MSRQQLHRVDGTPKIGAAGVEQQKHPGLAECGDVVNGLAVVEFDDGQRAVFYTSRALRYGHETNTEVIATEATRTGQAITQSLRSGMPVVL
jgi:hypothetical protein